MLTSLRVRFGVSHILPVLLLIPFLGFLLLYLLETQYFLENLAAELISQGKLIAMHLLEFPTLWSDSNLAQSLIDQLHLQVTSRIMILDAHYHLLGSSFEHDLARVGQTIQADVLNPDQQREIVWRIVNSINMHQRVVDVAVPVIDLDGTVLGFVRLSQSVGQMMERILPLRWLVVVALFFAGTLATGLGLLLARSLGLPLARLTKAVGEFQPGEVSGPIPETGSDDIRILASSFNQMASRLHESETEKKTLLAGIAHELGTSFGAIKAAAQALQRGAARDANLVVELADGIYHQVEHLGLLVKDLSLLNETRQQHDVELHHHWIDIHDLIYKNCQTYNHLIERKGIMLVIEIDKKLSSFSADETRICQILGNLLHNAYKFTPASGQITVAVTLLEHEHQGDEIRFQISDSGPGIAPEEQQRIFEMFYRSSAARNGFEGSGIGLALARQLAMAHGGSLTVDSQPGFGATFTLQLPITPPNTERA